MSVNVSNKKFIFNDTLDNGGAFIQGPFYSYAVYSNPIPWYSASYSSNTLTFNVWLSSTNYHTVTVYSSGTWTADGYKTIVFPDNMTLSDSVYEWLAANATEVTPYITADTSIAKIATAIRERDWSKLLLTYPDGFATAISNIGNYVQGASVALTQIWDETKIPSDSAIYSVTSYTTNGVTFEKNGDGSFTVYTDAGGATSDAYIKIATYYSPSIGLLNYYNYMRCYNGSLSTVYINLMTSRNIDDSPLLYPPSPSGYNMWLKVNSGAIFTDPVTVYPQIINVEKLLSYPLAADLYSLGSAAGAALIQNILPNVYAATSPTLYHVQYQDDLSIHTPISLPGLFVLKDSALIRDGNEYNNGTIYNKYALWDLDDAAFNWGYNSTYDVFYTSVSSMTFTGEGLNSASTTPNSISNAYPMKIFDSYNGILSDLETGYMYQVYDSSTTVKQRKWYVKDSTITSDHLNTFLSAIAGKKIVFKINNPSYTYNN